jgi:hypothetical protein
MFLVDQHQHVELQISETLVNKIGFVQVVCMPLGGILTLFFAFNASSAKIAFGYRSPVGHSRDNTVKIRCASMSKFWACSINKYSINRRLWSILDSPKA